MFTAIPDATIYELSAPVILVLKQGNYKITQGCAKIIDGVFTGPGDCRGVSFEGLTSDEVDDYHEMGWKVCEYTDDFVGYWRELDGD